MTHKTPMEDGYTPSAEGIGDWRLVIEDCTKILREGQLLIQRGGKTYTVQGQECR